MNYYGRLWVLIFIVYMRNGVIVCIYKFYKVVYGFLMMDFGIFDFIVVLVSRGIWYKYNLFL